MKNLRLLPAVHNNQAIVKAHFAFDHVSARHLSSPKKRQSKVPIQERLGHNTTETKERHTHVSNRIQERIESPIDCLIKEINIGNQPIKNIINTKNKVKLSEPSSDIY